MNKKGIQLKDRFLWNDGDSTVTADSLESLFKKGVSPSRVFVDELTSEIEELNRFLPPHEKIKTKKENRPFDFSWQIPKEYQRLDVVRYVSKKLVEECCEREFTDEEAEMRTQRVSRELTIFNTLGLFDVLRTIIYIINTFENENVVWGVGRGSSTHSYVLYLVGVHDIDSIDFNLNVEEFLRLE